MANMLKSKVAKNVKTEHMKDNVIGQKKKVLLRTLTSIAILAALANPSILIFLKDDNQWFIAPVCNPVLDVQTKHIDILYHYICDEVDVGRIEL